MMEVALILVLVLLNGVFAMSELAVVSARRARLEELAKSGARGAQRALALKDDPGAFLSTIQVGITTVGVLSGVIGERLFAAALAERIAAVPMLAQWSGTIAAVVVVGTITYLTVVLGELVPKRLALRSPERVAARLARPMSWLGTIARPFVWLLTASSNLVVRLLGGGRGDDEQPVSDDEIRLMVERGADKGVFDPGETRMVPNVLGLDDQPVEAIMTPRSAIACIDLDEDEPALRQRLAQCTYSRIVVCRGGANAVVGVLYTPELLGAALRGDALRIEQRMRAPLFVPNTVSTARLLDTLRAHDEQIALIVDEYGELRGLASLDDVTRAIVGSLPGHSEPQQPGETIGHQPDGSLRIGGGVGVERLREALELDTLPGCDDPRFHTAGGFAMHMLGRVPTVGERFAHAGWDFEIEAMDGTRVDCLRALRHSRDADDGSDGGNEATGSANDDARRDS